MISTVTLTFDLTYTNPTTGALEPRGIVTDSTNYSGPGGLGIDLLTNQAKGKGIITFNGDIIVDKNTDEDPLIDLENWGTLNPGQTPVYTFPLTLDTNGNAANGVYTFTYSLRLAGAILDVGINFPNDIQSTTGLGYVNFFEAGNQLLMLPSSTNATVVSASLNLAGDIMTIVTTGLDNDVDINVNFDITNVQLDAVYSYSGCVQATTDITFTYDCEVGTNGTFAVANSTVLNGQTIASLNATINYPAWTSLTPTFNSQIVTNTLPYSNNVLATGTFGVSLSQVIQKTQTDGLILQYTSSGTQEFVVSCVGSLCGLIPCMESLRNAHAAELQRNRISKYQVFVDNVLLYYTQAQNYRSCGDIEKYRSTLALIEAQLDASGCDCGCCDPDTFQWVDNNAASTIDTLINAIQFRLFDGIPAENEDSTQGVENGAIWEDTNTNILYLCTDNTAGSAVWVKFFDYQVVTTAADVSADPLAPLTANNVQGQLTQAATQLALQQLKNIDYDSDIIALQGDVSALQADAIVSASNGLTETANNVELGGQLTGDTVIDANGHSLSVTSTTGFLPLKVASNSIPFESRRVTGAGSNTEYTLLQITGEKTSGGGNGYGGTIDTRLSANSAGEYTASSIVTKWVNAGGLESKIDFKTSNGTLATALTLAGDGLVIAPNYGDGDFTPAITMRTPTYSLSVDSFGAIIETPLSSGPLVYIARITQTGSSVPTATVIANTTGATFTWSIIVSGIYRATASSAVLTTDKTAVYVTPSSSGAYIMMAGIASTTEFTVTSSNAFGLGGFTNGLINGAIVKIEIYP